VAGAGAPRDSSWDAVQILECCAKAAAMASLNNALVGLSVSSVNLVDI